MTKAKTYRTYCKRHGETEFYLSNKVCVACMRERGAERHKNNPEKARIRSAEYRRNNPEKARAASAKWHKENRERHLLASQKASLKRQYGITIEDKKTIYAAQNGKCRGCFEPMAFEEAHIDHDHFRKHVRALLHGNCNRIIGIAKENPNVLISLANYCHRVNPSKSA